MELKIRWPTPDDAQGIALDHVAFWRAAYRGFIADDVLDGLRVDQREQGWARWIESPHTGHSPDGEASAPHKLFVAEAGARIVGWASFGPGRDGDMSSWANSPACTSILSYGLGASGTPSSPGRNMNCVQLAGVRRIYGCSRETTARSPSTSNTAGTPTAERRSGRWEVPMGFTSSGTCDDLADDCQYVGGTSTASEKTGTHISLHPGHPMLPTSC